VTRWPPSPPDLAAVLDRVPSIRAHSVIHRAARPFITGRSTHERGLAALTRIVHPVALIIASRLVLQRDPLRWITL
jgi:hypothetical protein